MADVTREMILEYVVRKGGVVKNVDLVRHFRKYLQVDDPRLKDRTREVFKERVNTIAYIKAENGEKYLYLKPEFNPAGGLVRPASGRSSASEKPSSTSSQQSPHRAPPPPPTTSSGTYDSILNDFSPANSPDHGSKISSSSALNDSRTGNVAMSRQSDIMLQNYRPLSNSTSSSSSPSKPPAMATTSSSAGERPTSGSVFSPPPSANSTSSGLGDFGSSLLAEMGSFSLFGDSTLGLSSSATTSMTSGQATSKATSVDQSQASRGSGSSSRSTSESPKKTPNYSAYDSYSGSSYSKPALSSYAAYDSGKSSSSSQQPSKTTPSYSSYESQSQARKSSLTSEPLNQTRKSSLTADNAQGNQPRKSSLTGNEPTKKTSPYGAYEAYSASGTAKSSQKSPPRRQAPGVPPSTVTAVQEPAVSASSSSPVPKRPAPDIPSSARQLSTGRNSSSSISSQQSSEGPTYKSVSTSSLGNKVPPASSSSVASNSPSLSSATGKPYAIYGQPRRPAPTTPPSSSSSSPSSSPVVSGSPSAAASAKTKTTAEASSLYKSYGSSQKAPTVANTGLSSSSTSSNTSAALNTGAGRRGVSRASPPRKTSEQNDDPFASFFSSANPTFKQSSSNKKSMPAKSNSGDNLLSSGLSVSSPPHKSHSTSLLAPQSHPITSALRPSLQTSATATVLIPTPSPTVPSNSNSSSSGVGAAASQITGGGGGAVVSSGKPPPHPSSATSYHHHSLGQRHSSPPRRMGPSVEPPPPPLTASSSSSSSLIGGGGPHSPGRRTSAPATEQTATTNGHAALPPHYSASLHYHHRRQGSSEGGAGKRPVGGAEAPPPHYHRRQGSVEGGSSPAIRIESPTRSDSSSSPGAGSMEMRRSPGPATYTSLNPADPRPRGQSSAGGVVNGTGSLAAATVGVQLRRDKNAAEGKVSRSHSVATAAVRRSRNLADKNINLDSITRASIAMTPPTRRKVAPPSVAPKPSRDMAAAGSGEDLAMDPGEDDGSITALSEPDGEYYDIDPLEKEWMVAATLGDMESMHRLLMTEPSLVNRKDFIHGYTAIHWAAKNGRMDIIVGMMMNGGSVHIKSNGGLTPLHLAAQSGHDNAILLLVREHSANINAREHGGRKPYDLLPAKASEQTRALLSRVNTYGFTARRKVMGVAHLATFSQPHKKAGGGAMERGWSSVPQLVVMGVPDPDKQAKKRLSPRLSMRKTFSFRRKRDSRDTLSPGREKTGKKKHVKHVFDDYDV